MGHSSVAVAAANFTFLASGIHRLVERRDKHLNNFRGYVKNESTVPKEFTFEV